MKKTILIFCALVLLGANAFPQRQDTVDDGFTWFEAFPTTELQGNNIPTATGWTLKFWTRVLGVYPNRSSLNFVVSKNGKTLFSTRCETFVYRKTGADVDESFMQTAECWQTKSATKETGVFDVKVFTINGETNAEKLVRNYKIDVRAVGRVPSGQQPGDEPPHYIVMRHAEAAASFMFLRPAGYVSYFDYAQRPERSGANQVELHFSLSPGEDYKALPLAFARCTVNGKLLSMPGPMPYADQAVSQTVRWYQEIYQDRIAPQYKKGMEYRDEIRFQTVRVKMPLTWGKVRDENRLALEDYPGNWECSLMNNGETWRTWRWRIGRNGLPETHAEQKGNINLNYSSFLVEMEIPAGGSTLDKRLAPMAEAGFFYGQPWTSAEGKAMANRIPKKGNPFPVPSNQAK